MKTSIRPLLFSTLFSLSFVLVALPAKNAFAESNAADQEEELRERAKKRIYAGGRDEEPLQVQTQINRLSRKQIETPEANAHSNQDND